MSERSWRSRVSQAAGALSLTSTLLLVALVAGALGAVWLDARRSAEQRVVVVTRDVSAFAPIGGADVTLRAVPRSRVPRNALRSLDDVRGRYALGALDAGDVVDKSRIGPSAAEDADNVVLTFPLDAPSGKEIRRGQLVDLLVAPSPADVAPLVVRRVLVVDIRDSDDARQIAFVAVPRARKREIATVAGRGRATLAVIG